MNKQYLIKMTGYDNLYYNSKDKEYIYRMHCPVKRCGKPSGCRCFDTIEEAEEFMFNGVEFTCSSECSLNKLIESEGIDTLTEIMHELELTNFVYRFLHKYGMISDTFFVNRLSNDDVWNVLDNIDYDSVSGMSC